MQTVDDQDEETDGDAGCEGGSGVKVGERGAMVKAERSAGTRCS